METRTEWDTGREGEGEEEEEGWEGWVRKRVTKRMKTERVSGWGGERKEEERGNRIWVYRNAIEWGGTCCRVCSSSPQRAKKMEIGRLKAGKREMEKRDRETLENIGEEERWGKGKKSLRQGRGLASSRYDRHLYQAVGGGVCSKERSLSLVLCFTKARGEYICSSLTVLPSRRQMVSLHIFPIESIAVARRIYLLNVTAMKALLSFLNWYQTFNTFDDPQSYCISFFSSKTLPARLVSKCLFGMKQFTHSHLWLTLPKPERKKARKKRDVNEERDKCNSLVGEVRHGD